MPENNINLNALKPVSPDTLKTFDALLASVEEEVLRQCLSEDNPEHTMGPEAEAMVKSGLGFISTLVRATMVYGTEKIIEDQLAWCKTCLPGYGVSMKMILNNFERYDRALKKKLVPAAYAEVLPCLSNIIQRQGTMQFHNCAARLEQAANAGDLGLVLSALPELEKQFKLAVIEIRKRLPVIQGKNV